MNIILVPCHVCVRLLKPVCSAAPRRSDLVCVCLLHSLAGLSSHTTSCVLGAVTIVSSAGSACFALVVICIFVLWWRARHKDLEELIKLEDQDGELGLLSPPELAITSITSPANPQSTTPMVLKRDRQRSVTPVSARRLPASRPGTPERRLPRAVAKYIDASRFLGITSPGGMSSATPPSGSTTPPRGARLDVSSTPQTRTLRVAGHIVNDSMPRVVGRYVAAKHALPALRHVTPAKNRPASTPPVLQRPPSSPSEQNIVLQRPPSPPSERKITLPTRPHSPPRERTPPPLRDATPPKASSPGARRSVRQIVPPRLLPLRDDQTIPPPLVASDLSPPPLRDATPPPSPPFSNPSFYDPTHTITEAHMTLKVRRRPQRACLSCTHSCSIHTSYTLIFTWHATAYCEIPFAAQYTMHLFRILIASLERHCMAAKRSQ